MASLRKRCNATIDWTVLNRLEDGHYRTFGLTMSGESFDASAGVKGEMGNGGDDRK